MMKTLGCLCFLLNLVSGRYKVTLEEVSTVFLPSTNRRWDLDAANSASYDARDKLLYVVGGLYRFVIDMQNPPNLAPVRSDLSPQGNLEYKDVATCGDYVIVTYDDIGVRSRGTVEIYQKYNPTTPPTRVFSQEVGEDPTSVAFLPDCKTAVVAVRGVAYKDAATGQFEDPKGKILLLHLPDRVFSGRFEDNVNITSMDFAYYDSRVDSLLEDGARFVYRESNNRFSNDVDPRKLCLSPDGRTVYVGLQVGALDDSNTHQNTERSNAVAKVDTGSRQIVSVRGLGMKDWNNLKLDASDKDGGINLKKWPIFSYYLPDGIAHMTVNNVNYILTANEGDDYDYRDLNGWTEELRGRDFLEKNLTSDSLSNDMKTLLSNDSSLGRMLFTTQNGEDGNYTKFVAFGGRSFSIWEADSMRLMYDSGDELERYHAALIPDFFNADVNETHTPKQDADKLSPKRGPEPEAITTGYTDGLNLIFVGSEGPGTIAVYSILNDVKKPKFESIWNGIPNADITWQDLYSRKLMKSVDPEKLIFLPKDKSPTGKAALIVVASQSGTVTLLNIKITGKVPQLNGSTDVFPCASMLLLTFLSWLGLVY